MGLMQETYALILDAHVTIIDGQITIEDWTQLQQKLCKVTAGIPTTLGGETLGHVGLVLQRADYVVRSNGNVDFNIPAHPGAVPTTLSADATTRARELAQHKHAQMEYEVCKGVKMGIKELMKKACPDEYLAGITDPILGLANVTVREIMAHLKIEGATLGPEDIQELSNKAAEAWSIDISSAVYWMKQDEYVRQLETVGVPESNTLCLERFKADIRATGEYTVELAEWEAKPTADKTFANFKPFFQKKWTDKRRFNQASGTTARGALANTATSKKKVQFEDEAAKEPKEINVSDLLALLQGASDPKLEKFMTETNAALTSTTKALEALAAKVGNSNGGGA